MVQIKMIRHSERYDFTYPLSWGIRWLAQYTYILNPSYLADSPLTSNGLEMAKEKAKELVSDNFNPKFIYTSPYNRTMVTSTEIKEYFPHSEIVIEPLLAEYQPNFAHHISLYPNGIPTTYDGQKTEFSYPESYENFTKRILFIVSKLVERHDGDFIIVTHGEVLKVYVNYIQSLYPDIMLDGGSIPYLTTLSFEYDKENNCIDPNCITID